MEHPVDRTTRRWGRSCDEKRLAWTALFAAGLVALAFGHAPAAPFYSIDWQSIDTILVSEGDVLTSSGAGTTPPPTSVIPFGAGGLGASSSAAGYQELDALSFGLDPRLPTGAGVVHGWIFSVDEWAAGQPGVPFPSVTTEGAGGATEASADIYTSATAPGPITGGPVGTNSGLFDGNGGATPFAAAGLNLREPNPPSAGAPDQADNVDAFDMEGVAGQPGFPVYYSLDAVPGLSDPLEGVGGTGTAAANGFTGADVLVSTSPGGPPVLYADALTLGLDPNFDDIDALILWENGVPGFQIPTGPYSWLGPQPTDMLLFSLRRESPSTYGVPDSLGSGLDIEEGDILMPLPGLPPGIFVAAEKLGLLTRRNTPGIMWGDDLNALDVRFLQGPGTFVPEPSTLLLLLGGLAGALLAVRWPRGRKLLLIAVAVLLPLSSAQPAHALLNEFSVADGYMSPFSTRVWTYNSLWTFDGGALGSNYVAQHGYNAGFAFNEPFALVVRNDSAPGSYQFHYDFQPADLAGETPSSISPTTLSIIFDVCSTVAQNSQTANGTPMLTMAFGPLGTPALTLGFSDSNYLMWSDSSGNLNEFTGYTLNSTSWDRVYLTMDFTSFTYDLSVASMIGDGINGSNTYTPTTTYNVVSGMGFTNNVTSLAQLDFSTFTDPEDGGGWHKAFFDNFDSQLPGLQLVPEPSACLLAVAGFLGLAVLARRPRRRRG